MSAAPISAIRRLPRTIQLDPSDLSVFEIAAQPGEWAVSGGFMFIEQIPGPDEPKRRQAFANGWLGIHSFAWASLVVVSDIAANELTEAVSELARQFVARLSAPSLDEALVAAQSEIAFAASLCEQPVGTLLALSRTRAEDGVVETVRTIVPAAELDRAWTIAPQEGAAIDLVALARRGIRER
jgi:hypothetical protein